MDSNKILEAVEQFSLPRRLSSIEQFVLNQSWLGQSYKEMAQKSGYGSEYIKEIGSQLWQDLSDALGEKVTKKNLHLVLNQYRQDRTVKHQKSEQLEFPPVAEINNEPTVVIDTEISFPSGPVALNSPLYINRPLIEELAFSEISQPGCLIRIKAPRKMGKSSLLNRMIADAKDRGYKTVYVNFQETDETVFTKLDKFLRWLCANISRQLNLIPRLDDYWDEDMGSKVSCKIYFEAYLHKQIDTPILLALDEVNRVFEHPNIAQDFLPMLRFWHEQAKQNRNWEKMRFVVCHTTEVYVPLKLNQSPFNVGLSITLPQFTLEQVEDLAQRYGLDWLTSNWGVQALATLKAMVGGHPYLVNLALYYLRRTEIALSELLQKATTPSGIYSEHLRSHLAILTEQPQLASAMRQVVTAEESVLLEAITAYRLESMGLIQLDGNHATPSCELYRLYFQEQLREEK